MRQAAQNEMRRVSRQHDKDQLEAEVAGGHLDVSAPEIKDTLKKIRRQLSPRELTVFALMTAGHMQAEIGQALGIDQTTVSRIETHIRQICKEVIQ